MGPSCAMGPEWLVLAALLACLPSAFTFRDDHRVSGLSHLLSAPSYAGLLPVSANSTKPSELFYWLFLAQNGKLDAPLVVWMNGGPGLSSMFGLFNELGPLQIDSKGQLLPRALHWNDMWHLLFVDQPVGVGFSEYDTATGPLRSIKETTAQLWGFFQALRPASAALPRPPPHARLRGGARRRLRTAGARRCCARTPSCRPSASTWPGSPSAATTSRRWCRPSCARTSSSRRGARRAR